MNLSNMTEEEIKGEIEDLGIQGFRADQIFRAINAQNIKSIDDLYQLSKDDREKLKSKFEIGEFEILEVYKSKLDPTRKLLYKLRDDYLVEGVLMEYKHGYSLCVSTQVGCRMGCSFCASTKDGLVRNLEPYEIVSQLYSVEEKYGIKIRNIVLMGSGEPLDNYDNVLKALRILGDPKGRNISLRSITLSTCGVAPKIVDLAQDMPQIGLAISLHSVDQSARAAIMPVAKAYDLDQLLDSINRYQSITNNRVSFEYTVIPGDNDSKADAKRLKKWLQGLNYIVNLIALNPVGDYNKDENYYQKALDFKDELDHIGVNNTLRRELGSDISASCGQLKQYYLEEGGPWNI